MENKDLKFKKIAFFDEQAAFDLLNIYQGGSAEKIVSKMSELTAGAQTDAMLHASVGFFSGLKFRLSGNAKASGSSIVETQVKSTILTEFLNLVENNNDFGLVKIDELKLELTDDSAAYFRTLSKYMKMISDIDMLTDDSSPDNIDNIQALKSFDFSNLNTVLDEATGYYEFIGHGQNSEKYIIRFNYEGIRNNYKLTDLTKMNLRVFGVKVGQTSSLNIALESEITMSKNVPIIDEYKDILVETIEKESSDASTEMYDVIDIVIAGVC